MSHFLHRVEMALFTYYQENYLEYRELVGEDEADKVTPEIQTIAELNSFVTPTELIVRRVRENGIRRLGLLFDCCWDDNGVGVRIENESIVEIGYQDIVL